MEYNYIIVPSETTVIIPQIAINRENSQYLTIQKRGENLKFFVGTDLVYERDVLFFKNNRAAIGFFVTSQSQGAATATFDDVTFTILDDELRTAPDLSFKTANNQATTLVYPNPSTGTFNINLNNYFGEEVRLEVLNLEGGVMKIFQYDRVSQGIQQLELEELNSGLYILKVKSSANEEQLRLVIQQ